MYLRGKELQFELTKQFKSAYKEVKMAWLHFAFVNTIGYRFMFGFVVGHISNTIEH